MAQIFDIDGNTINPATEEGQAAILAALSDSDLNFETMEDHLAAIKIATELIEHQTASNAGNVDANTQRVAIATDDINLAAIKIATEATKAAVEALADTGLTFETDPIDVTAAVPVQLIAAPGAGKHLEIYEIYLRSGISGTVLFQDDGGTNFTGVMPVGTNDLVFMPWRDKPRYICGTNKKFEADIVDATLKGHIIYVDVTD